MAKIIFFIFLTQIITNSCWLWVYTKMPGFVVASICAWIIFLVLIGTWIFNNWDD